MAPTHIFLFRGVSWISGIIRAQTRSNFAHAAIALDETSCVEAVEFAGVRTRVIGDFSDVTRCSIEGITPEQLNNLRAFALRQVGKSYDYKDVFRFLTPAHSHADQERWFCSELVAAAAEAAGIPLLSRIDPAEVSPGILSLSPLLIAHA